MKKISFICTLLYVCSSFAIEVNLSTDEVFQGDSLSLSITDSKPIGQVDLAPLSKDFVFGGQQRGQSSRFVNGVGSTTYELGVVLFPTKTGQIQIPALKVGNETTEPLTLTVKNREKHSSIAEAEENPLVQLNARVSNETPYVGQSLFYTVQVTDLAGIVSGEIIPGENDKVHISQVGQDAEKTLVQKGKRIRKIERTYRLVPQESGNLTIEPTIFNGEISYQQPRRKTYQPLFGFLDGGDFFQDFMASTRPIQAISDSIRLNVKEKPSDWSGWWLPSTEVQLNVSYQRPDNLKVGDAVQGELTLTAVDVDANDMPVIKVTPTPDFRIYPEPEERVTQVNSDSHITGVVKIKFSLVPLKGGMIEIPEIQVPWFNTKIAQKEVAKIDAYLLNVAPGEVVLPVLLSESPPPQIVEENGEFVQNNFWSGLLYGFGIAVLTFVLLGVGLYFILRCKKHKKKEKKKPIPDFYPFK